MESRHVLLITYPAQGHLNPSLQFAQRLLRHGFHVTLATTVFAHRRISHSPLPPGLSFAVFSDGYDHGFNHQSDDAHKHMAEIRHRGSKALRSAILTAQAHSRPITCLVYTLLLPWATLVAREFNIPSALLWIQPSSVLDIYYYYFNGFKHEIHSKSSHPSWTIRVPGIPPPLAAPDLPSFLVPSKAAVKFADAVNIFKEQLEILDAEERPKVLVNTFDALEADALTAIEKYEQIAIGPLIPPSFLDDASSYASEDKYSFSGDLFVKSSDCVEWLNSKEKLSVIYVSFGSLLTLEKAQMEEIARGLIDCGRPFLWVIRAKEKRKDDDDDDDDDDDEKLSCLDELEKLGKIVPWCCQLQVLTHPSMGCFVTHCGWNSTLESLSCGVPVVAFPHWTDQGTNAKLIQDVWRSGVRVRSGDDGLVSSREIHRCVEQVMNGGDLSMEFRKNAQNWKDLARQASGVNGSSTQNLKAFFQEI